MCGINAIVDFDRRVDDKRERISRMNALMVYRGPDGEGMHVDDRVALGMRRLSIIDVAGGAQPIYNEDRSAAIICNGEIYNYVELMRDLQRRGHVLSSHSDTEVILHLYEELGEACLQELRGMFAFVIWDIKKGRIFAARDRIGIKPLYLSREGGCLWLSSELKTIVAAAGISPTLRPAAVHEFLTYSYPIDQRHTVLEQVERVLPGEYVVADASGVRLTRYWEPSFGGDDGLNQMENGQLLDVLQTAVGIHLRSDVPVGILLSGGLDSSTLAAIAAQSGADCSVICAGYAGKHAMDEREVARSTARSLGLKFLEVVSDSRDFNAYFDEMIHCCDEPVGDIAAMAQWALYKQSRTLGLKVLLSGIGGDELMFGYPAWNDLGASLGKNNAPQEARTRLMAEGLCTYMGSETRQIALGPLAAAANNVLAPLFELCRKSARGPDEVAAALFGTYLVHNGCQLADKLGMGCSVEVRVPLLDHVFVEAVLGLPLARRFNGSTSKPLLKELMQGQLPGTLLNAPKKGFSPPGRFIMDIVHEHVDCVLGGELVRSGWVDSKRLGSIVRNGQALPWLKIGRLRNLLGLVQSPWFLFRVIAFERWYETICSLRSDRQPAVIGRGPQGDLSCVRA